VFLEQLEHGLANLLIAHAQHPADHPQLRRVLLGRFIERELRLWCAASRTDWPQCAP
jgi:hypothetical protein